MTALVSIGVFERDCTHAILPRNGCDSLDRANCVALRRYPNPETHDLRGPGRAVRTSSVR
jgi:hypothetical protein